MLIRACDTSVQGKEEEEVAESALQGLSAILANHPAFLAFVGGHSTERHYLFSNSMPILLPSFCEMPFLIYQICAFPCPFGPGFKLNSPSLNPLPYSRRL